MDDDGYLTGYPLSESGFFALARTWPAPEMPRPGCVWTHTLLIDFTDLAAMDALSGITEAFRRPKGHSDFHSYEKPARPNFAHQVESPSISEAWTRSVVSALYGRPKSRIVVARSGPEVDTAVLAIWSQQWPRLRRNFRFCTLAASDRSAEGARFDLQVLPSQDRSLRSRFSEVVDVQNVESSSETWLTDALQDLLQPDCSGLRSFFRQLGSDVAIGREAFRPLCQLHRTMAAFSKKPEVLHDAVTILQDEFGEKQGRTARAIVTKAALESVDTLDEQSFDFLWSNLSLVEPEILDAFAAKLGRATWHREPERLTEPLPDEYARSVLERTLAELNVKELITGLQLAPRLVGPALARRPEIVQQPSFWTSVEAVEASFKTVASHSMQSAAVAAMLKAGRADLAPTAVRAFGAGIALEALKVSSQAEHDDIGAWIQAATSDRIAVAEFLSKQPSIPRGILYLLARSLPPDTVPNEYGLDPWLIAWGNSTGEIDDFATIYLAAYFLSRALGARSRSQAELAEISFEPTHVAAAADRLPEECWNMVEPRLPRSIFWFEWDRCQRLRAGVTDLFVDGDLPPSIFARLAQNDELFLSLITGAARNRRGRAYLERVYRLMKDGGDNAFKQRVRAVERLMG